MKSDSVHYITVTLRYVLITVTVLFFIRFFLFEPGTTEGRSMEPTFLDNDYFLVEKLSDLFYPLRRGEIIQALSPDGGALLVKRIIALPSEQITMKNGVISITDSSKGSFVLHEPYLASRLASEVGIRESDFTLDIPSDAYFVMGDNRLHSSDSRLYGPIHRSSIIGRVFSLHWLNKLLDSF